jgi:4-hydroxy-tetrahydrodipicolinate reductase
VTYRVVQWGTGWAGRQAIPGILGHPDLELVGVYVTSDEKDGRDAGELAGIDPIGIPATTDVDRIMDLDADCHLFMLQGHRPRAVRACVEQMATILAAGQNVCQTSVVPLYYPDDAPPEVRDPIVAACAAGGARCYSTGVYPGLMSDTVPMALLAGCERVDRIRITEILNYIQYYGAAEARQIGIGGPMDAAEEYAQRVAAGTMTIVGAGIRHLGRRLGVEIEELRTGAVEVAPALERAEVEGYVIEPGTFGALRHVTQGWAGGRPVVEFAFVTRYDDAAAPDWPRARGGYGGCYRIEVHGSLSLDVDVNLIGHREQPSQTNGFATSSAQLGAYLMTTAPAINAIPFLCRSEPGLYGSMDLDRTQDLHVVTGFPTRDARHVREARDEPTSG